MMCRLNAGTSTQDNKDVGITTPGTGNTYAHLEQSEQNTQSDTSAHTKSDLCPGANHA